MVRFFLLLAVVCLTPAWAVAEEEEADWLPDLSQVHTSGWGNVGWTSHRNQFRARKAGAKAELWTQWPLAPRPGDRSLLVFDVGGVRTGLIFHEAKGLTRVEIVSQLPVDEVITAVQRQLGEGVAPQNSEPLPVRLTWVENLTIVAALEGGAAVIVEAPRDMTESITLLPYEPWDREGPVSREAARTRLALGVPLLATSFVAALVMLPFATKDPGASIAVAVPLGVGISVGTALTISGATKLRGSLPRKDLDAWKAAGSMGTPPRLGGEQAPGLR